ncbi:MAG: hypothetical protein ACYDD1_00300 [Caulobacteraceae bacterium]
MTLRALLQTSTAVLVVMSLCGCNQKQSVEGVAPAFDQGAVSPTVESESAAINSQSSINEAVTQQQRYQKILEGDPGLRAKQKAVCQGGEQNAFLLPAPLQRPCRALADAEFNAQLNAERQSHVSNTNSL